MSKLEYSKIVNLILVEMMLKFHIKTQKLYIKAVLKIVSDMDSAKLGRCKAANIYIQRSRAFIIMIFRRDISLLSLKIKRERNKKNVKIFFFPTELGRIRRKKENTTTAILGSSISSISII